MRTLRCVLAGGGLMSLLGCASLDATPHLDESMDLIQERTGHRPAWSAPWDAQPPPWDGSSVLTADEAVVIALRNNRGLRADLEMIGQANADLVQAGLMSNPVVSFMVMFPSGGGRSMLRGSELPMQPLQDLWLIPARKDVARARLREAVLRLADQAVALAAEVKRTYARIQYAQRALSLIDDNQHIVDQATQIFQIRQAAGRGSQAEVNLSRIRSMRLASDRMTLRAEYDGARRELLAMMGLAEASAEWQVQPLDEMATPLPAVPPEEGLMLAASQQRLDLQAISWQAESARRDIALAKREGWPDLALGMTFERAAAPPSQNQQLAGRLGNAAAEGAGGGMGRPAPAPFSPKPRDVKYTLGPMIDIEVPIFDQNQAQVAKALHMYQQKTAEYEDLAQRIVGEVRKATVMRRQALEQVEFFRRSLIPEVRRNLELTNQSFASGREDLTVYLQVQEDYIEQRLRALEFLRDYLVQTAELERLVGGRLSNEGSTKNRALPASVPANPDRQAGAT